MKPFVFYFDDKLVNFVVASDLVEALSRIPSDKVSHIVKVECPPFEVI